MRVVGVQQHHRTCEHVHDVRGGVAHDHGSREAVRQLALRIDGGNIVVKLLLRRQLAHQQQVGHLFIIEAPIFRIHAKKVVQVVTTKAQLAGIGHFFAIGHNVAMYVGNASQACQNARTVVVT